MTRILRQCWPVGIVFLFALQSQTLHAQAIQQIEIRHVGPPAASDDMIRAHLQVKVGDQYADYERSGLQADFRSLYSTGLFENIRTDREERPNGLALIYLVQGKLRLAEVSFEGNKSYVPAKLLKNVTSKTGAPLDEQKLFADAQALEKFYEKDGFQGTKVRYRVTSEESTGQGRVTFEIAERPKVIVTEINFDGATFPESKLRKIITTKRRWMFSFMSGTGLMKDDEIQIDKDQLAEFYQGEGYADFEVKEVRTEYPDPTRVKLQFVISEGIKYKVSSIDVRGNSAFKTETILAKDTGLLMQAGDLFTPKGLDADTDRIRDFYHRRGYLDTDVRVVKVPDTASGTVAIVFEIVREDVGPSYLERVQIRGNTKTKDKVIRRELAVAPGEIFDYVRIQRSKGRLEQTGFFEKVETTPEPTDVPNRKDLIVDVEEGTTGHVEFGAGFSSVESISGFVGYREGNFDLFNPPYFRGAGQKLRADISIGTKKQDYELSFAEPWFLDRKLEFEVGLYHRSLNYYSDLYDVRQTGGRLSLTEPLGSEFLIGQVSYTLENIGILHVQTNAPSTIIAEQGTRLVSKFGSSIIYDTRNNAQLPNHGGRTELEGSVAGGFLGGDTDFYKLELRSSWYFPGAFDKHVIEVRGRAGGAESFGSSSDKPVPLFDRFFLGGTGSLRGYRYRDVGPSQTGEPLGGQTYWFGSVEYSLPLIERIRLAAFYDIGNVYSQPFSLARGPDQKAYSDDVGIGFRVDIPRLGPLRFDYGFPISHDKTVSGSGKFQFSVGWTSDY